MARIRTIKPEFWDSASVGESTLRARLMFIAMWNWADDYGIGDATPIRLVGFAFPNDEMGVADFPPLREEISERFQVVFYKHEGRPYYYIPSWEKHQRTEKRAKQRIPFPHEIENVEITDVSQKVAENPTPRSGNAAAGTGEQGNRGKGTGEQGKEVSRKERASDPDFDAFWDAYGKKLDRAKAERAFKSAKKKVSPLVLINAAREHAAWHVRAGTEPRYIKHAATWLNAEAWADERPEPGVRARPMSAAEQRVAANAALTMQLRAEQETQQRAIEGNA